MSDHEELRETVKKLEAELSLYREMDAPKISRKRHVEHVGSGWVVMRFDDGIKYVNMRSVESVVYKLVDRGEGAKERYRAELIFYFNHGEIGLYSTYSTRDGVFEEYKEDLKVMMENVVGVGN